MIISGHLKMLRETLTDLIGLGLSLMSTFSNDWKNPYVHYNTCAQSVHPKAFLLYTMNSIRHDEKNIHLYQDVQAKVIGKEFLKIMVAYDLGYTQMF